MRRTGALVLFAALLLAISLSSARQKGPTFDESAHIPAGYTYATLRDFRMNPEHPPLMKLVSALPLLFLGPRVNTADPSWSTADPDPIAWVRNQWAFGEKFLYEWNDADRVIFWARVPIVLLSVFLGLAVSSCARQLYGEKAGYLALALYLVSPDLLAHGQLVTTDLGVACFTFLAVWAFFQALRRPAPTAALLAGLAAGLALASKFSGLLVFSMLIPVGIGFALSPTPMVLAFPRRASPHRVVTSRRGKLAGAAALVVVTAAIAIVVVWACYGFRYRVSPDPEVSTSLAWEHYWRGGGLASRIVRIARPIRPLPEAYLYGVLYAAESLDNRSAFLLGARSRHGWWYYFLVTFLVKTPIPFMALLILALLGLRRYGAGVAAESMLLLPVGLYWAVALASGLNIGHRHLLPIYPFLIVFTAKLARAFDAPAPRLLRVACAVLVAWSALEAALVYPHFLAYFNQIAGGPTQGYRWLVDSNLDWGQDVMGLGEYRRAHADAPLYVSYFGTGKPEFYGVRGPFLPGSLAPGLSPRTLRDDVIPFARVPPGAAVAVSATNLQCAYFTDEQVPGIEAFMRRLRRTQPIAWIGYSILVYRAP